MITHIKGLLIEKSPTEVVIETNGVGYSINISLNTFSKLGDDDNIKLFTDYLYKPIHLNSIQYISECNIPINSINQLLDENYIKSVLLSNENCLIDSDNNISSSYIYEIFYT